MKELILYGLVALSGLLILGFSVHMLLGGMVAQATEYRIIAVVCGVGAVILGYLAWDVIRRRY